MKLKVWMGIALLSSLLIAATAGTFLIAADDPALPMVSKVNVAADDHALPMAPKVG